MGVEIKYKPCKGTGKAKGYGCRKDVLKRTYGLGMSCCYVDWLLNSPEGKAKVAKNTLKATKPRKDFEQFKKNHKRKETLKGHELRTKAVVHAAIRRRDKGKPCSSCGTGWNSDFQACHYHKAELYNALRFNEDNIHGGCVKCNIHLNGNLEEYTVRLPHRIGQDKFNELNRLAELSLQTNHHWMPHELDEIINYYKNKWK